MSTKTIDKIARLLAQAEGTDNEAEAEAFLAKAQQLATFNAIDLEIARQHQSDKLRREEPIQKRIPVVGQGDGPRGGGRGAANRPLFVSLFLGIARANDVTCDIAHNSTSVVAFGFPSDIEVCEALFASLSLQMVDAAQRAVKAGEHKLPDNLYWSPGRWKRVKVTRTWSDGYKYDDWDEEYVEGSYRADARVFKKSFYEGFVSRIEARLMTIKRETEKAAEAREVVVSDEAGTETSSNVGLVLVGKREEIGSFYKAKSNARGSWGGVRDSGPRAYGAKDAGRAAADSARLGTARGIAGAKGSIAS